MTICSYKTTLAETHLADTNVIDVECCLFGHDCNAGFADKFSEEVFVAKLLRHDGSLQAFLDLLDVSAVVNLEADESWKNFEDFVQSLLVSLADVCDVHA